ncbi:MAG: hypothetical protein WCO67_17450 [Betaproteobacteria bacterium]
MTEFIDGEITGPVLRNGRLYFSASDSAFFPADSFGDRAKGKRGLPLSIQAGTETFSTDIRTSSSVRISPRHSFAAFLESSKAAEGMKVRLHRLAPREFRLELLR